MDKGFTLWFTGMSGAGKSTITGLLIKELEARKVPLEVLDGDVVRTNLSKGLGFSKEDRDTNIRRIGWVATTLTKHGVGVICAAISPYRNIRAEVREEVEKHGAFVEVFAKCDIEVLKVRDPKGLYAKAISGEIPNFTGISDPYEEPENPEVLCDTDAETVEESAAKILTRLEELGLIPSADPEHSFSADEEEKLGKRLENLGYM
ncbi:MAG: adenylyl-sulfate kinase [Planctomycetota bacterium]|jgi:adenylyl-sulfate kinase